MSTNFSLLAISLLLATTIVIGVLPLSQAAFCTYYRSSNTVRCGSVTCNTVDAGASELPPGYYLIGEYYSHRIMHLPWFNLYRSRSSGGYWDYHTKVPELGCRGGFGLHPGGISDGCITVIDSNCFNQLTNEINKHYKPTNFNAYECINCVWKVGCIQKSIVSRSHTADLVSV